MRYAIALLAWLALTQPSLASSFIQSAVHAVFSGTTSSVTLSGVGTGHSIRAFVALNPNTLTIGSLKDGANNSYTVLSPAPTGGGYVGKVGYFINSPSGTVTVTVTASTTCAACILMVEEWSGDQSSNTTDGYAGTYTADGVAGVNLPSGNVVMANSGDDLWTVCYSPEGKANTVPTGFTLRSNFFANPGSGSANKIQSASGTVSVGWTSITGANNNLVLAVAFAQGGAAPVGTTAGFFAPSFP